MGLFGKKKTDEIVEHKSIKPVIVRTDNVAKELLGTAAANKVPVTSLDFNLLDVQTFTRNNEGGKEAEWEELSTDEVKELSHDRKSMLEETFQIRQMYEVEIYSVSEETPLSELDISVGANSVLTKVYLSIKPGSTLSYYEQLQQDLVKLVNRKKLRANLLINVFDEPMRDVIEKLAAKVRVNETLSFEKKEMFLIAEGIEPVETIDDKLIFHYRDKAEAEAEGGRVDYAKRGFVLSVVPDELIIEYIKPKKGESGRNCRGEFIAPKEPEAKFEPTFTVSDKIKVDEDDSRIRYIAKEGGYVTEENNTFDVRTEMEVGEISFKTTGSIETELSSDVSISVKETDVLKDAVGMGMEVEVNELNVQGNIGPNAKVWAKKAAIEGQTHQSSEVHADELSINIHKGRAFGKSVKITRLEQGVVEGDKVTVSQMLGGKIVANEIEVEILASHAQLTATKRIEIQRLKGEENVLIIDPVCLSTRQNEIAENEAKIKEARQHIKDVEKEVEKHQKLLSDNAAVFADLKKRLLHYKKNGVKMPTSFVKKYQNFQQMQTHLAKLNEELREKQTRLEMLGTQHESFQTDILEARVINRDRWKGHNEVKFRLVEPHIELLFVPPGTAKIIALGLKENEEGTFSIVEVDE